MDKEGIFYRKRKENGKFRVSMHITGDSMLEDVVHYEGYSDKSYQDARTQIIEAVERDIWWLNKLKDRAEEFQKDF